MLLTLLVYFQSNIDNKCHTILVDVEILLINFVAVLKIANVCDLVFYHATGDSGGPLIIPDTQDDAIDFANPELDQIIGIISFGDDCKEDMDAASAHTQVNMFLPWIHETLATGLCMLKVLAGSRKDICAPFCVI